MWLSKSHNWHQYNSGVFSEVLFEHQGFHAGERCLGEVDLQYLTLN